MWTNLTTAILALPKPRLEWMLCQRRQGGQGTSLGAGCSKLTRAMATCRATSQIPGSGPRDDRTRGCKAVGLSTPLRHFKERLQPGRELLSHNFANEFLQILVG